MTMLSPAVAARTAREVQDALTAALADPVVMDEAIQSPTLVEATTMMLTSIGLRPYIAWADVHQRIEHRERTAFICAIVAGDEVGEVTLAQNEYKRWNSMQADITSTDLFPSLMPGLRKRLMTAAATTVASGNMSLLDILTDPMDDDDLPASVAFRTGILGAWWEARMSEGYTPETAHMLLTLTAHPSVLARLRREGVQAPFLTAP